MHGKRLPKAGDEGAARVAGLTESLNKFTALAAFARERIALLPKVSDAKRGERFTGHCRQRRGL